LVDQPLHHIPLVVQRQLDGHRRKLLEPRRRLGDRMFAVLEIGPDDFVAVDAEDRKYRQDGEVRRQHRPVEPSEVMDARERLVAHAAHQPFRCGLRSEQRGYKGYSHTWTRKKPERPTSLTNYALQPRRRTVPGSTLK